MTSAKQLLRDIDHLSFPDRQRLLASTARDLRGLDFERLLDDLYSGDYFARGTALFLAVAARNERGIDRALMSNRADLVPPALAAAVRLGLAEDRVVALIADMPAAFRRKLYHACRRHEATHLAERLLGQAYDLWGAVEAAMLLPACTSNSVERMLPRVEHAVSNWTAIAARHPEVVLAYLSREFGNAPRASWQSLGLRFGPALAVLSRSHPADVLAVARELSMLAALPTALLEILPRLARHDRDGVLALITDPHWRGAVPAQRKLWLAFKEAPEDDLAALGRLVRAQPGGVESLLRILAPGRRHIAYEAAFPDRGAVIDVPLSVLDLLPHQVRHQEAQRRLAIPAVADNPHMHLQHVARLDWETARPILRQATLRATAPERSEAYPLYVASAAATRSPDVLESMIASLDRLTHEQEPVRAPALAALANVSAALLTDAAARRLGQLLTAAMQARDASWQTRRVVTSIAGSLVAEGGVAGRPSLVTVGLDLFGLAGQQHSSPALQRLDRRLPRGAEDGVLDMFMSRLRADARRGQYGLALALTGALGKRAHGLQGLQSLLNEARSAKNDAVARRAIEAWLEPPGSRDERIERVLKDDPTSITVHVVQRILSTRRTDLLDKVLDKPLRGRFLSPGVRHVPNFFSGFERWLPRQVAVYAGLLNSVARNADQPASTRASAVHRLGRLPGTTGIVRDFAGNQERAVREAALAALAWTDEPASVIPELTAHADGDNSLIAIYALGRCALYLSPSHLGGTFEPLLAAKKVSTRKEGVRLVAQMRVRDASSHLVRAWSVDQQHRDVRRAIVSSLRGLLDDDVSWEMLTEAAGDGAVATAVLETSPESLPDRHRARYGALVQLVAAHPEPTVACAGMAVLPSWARWNVAGSVDTLTAAITSLHSTATWRAAVSALMPVCLTLEDTEPVLRAIADLVAQIDVRVAGRDQPARQRLAALASQLVTGSRQHDLMRVAASESAAQLVDVMASTAVELAAAGIWWLGTKEEMTANARTVMSMAIGRIGIRGAAESVAASLRPYIAQLNVEPLHSVAADLTSGDGSRDAWLALVIVVTAGQASSWQLPWVALLEELRTHAEQELRDAAFSQFTAPE